MARPRTVSSTILTTQPAVQFGFLPVTVVKESAIAVDDPVLPFVEHSGDRLLLERMQRRAFAVLHAVIRPESLRASRPARPRCRVPLVLAGETAVLIRRMPVRLATMGSPRASPVDKRIGYVDGTVAFRNRQRAAGAKVVLQSTSNSARCAIRPP